MNNITQDTVVTAWLKAESESPRFAQQLHDSTENLMAVINGPDEAARMNLLITARGRHVRYFPWEHVNWTTFDITTKQQLGDLRTCPGLPWLAFTQGDRLLSSAARWIATQPEDLDPHKHVRGIQQKVDKGEPIPPIVAYVAENGACVLLEGHARSVSYYLSEKTAYPITIFLGTSHTPEDLHAYDSGRNLAEIRAHFLKEAS